jgi:hypothetical protein
MGAKYSVEVLQPVFVSVTVSYDVTSSYVVS